MATKTPAKTGSLSKMMNGHVKSASPILDNYKAQNPHKQSDKGWDKAAATLSSLEFADRVQREFTAQELAAVEKCFRLMAEYVPFGGWKNPTKAIAAKFGLTKYESAD